MFACISWSSASSSSSTKTSRRMFNSDSIASTLLLFSPRRSVPIRLEFVNNFSPQTMHSISIVSTRTAKLKWMQSREMRMKMKGEFIQKIFELASNKFQVATRSFSPLGEKISKIFFSSLHSRLVP